jgi:protein tyrosine/serine phosphatase
MEPAFELPRLEGAPNFRDLGGLPTADGRFTRHGVLFRSGGLEELTSPDVRFLIDDIGLRTIFDLRSADDCETAPSLRDTPVRLINVPIFRAASAANPERPIHADGRADVARIYRMYMERSIPAISEIIGELTSGATPAMFHCAAGKDRTGVVAAILLSAVGVTRDAVIADYMKTAPVLDQIIAFLQRRKAYADVLQQFPAGMLDADPNYMIDFLDDVERMYGGIAAWLTEHAGFSAESLGALEQLLVEPRS